MLAKNIVTRTYYKNHTQTFNASSSFQTFSVPSTTTELSVDCVASKGADGQNRSGANGGRVTCILPVTPSSTLYFYVGNIPSAQQTAEYNASDIRTNNAGVTNSSSLSSRLIVAGGGGSAGKVPASSYGPGVGGGLTGGNGQDSTYCGKGGSQTAGGAAGSSGSSGSFGLGGNGLSTGFSSGYGPAGAGGAGWYGGGGGGGKKTLCGSGGGGSSYTDSSCYNVEHTQGYNAGTGYITINYTTISTSADYDFYKDTYQTKVLKYTTNNTDSYYAVNEYKKGQHYGS